MGVDQAALSPRLDAHARAAAPRRGRCRCPPPAPGGRDRPRLRRSRCGCRRHSARAPRAASAGMPRRDEVREGRPLRGQHRDRAERADSHRLDEAGDGGQDLRQRSAAGELLEHGALGERDALGELRLPGPVGQLRRLVGHQAHGLHDAAPLAVHRLELRAHELQQQPVIGHVEPRPQRRLPRMARACGCRSSASGCASPGSTRTSVVGRRSRSARILGGRQG